jgi:tellurite resistance protein TerC
MTASIGTPLLWASFLGFVFFMLALDLGVFHRKAHAITLREASAWTAVWVVLSGVFAVGVHWMFGPERALEFVTGYLIEKALSVDNIFVFVLVFGAFGIPGAQQHRVLFWGILGALALRAAFIFAGGAFLARFHWAIYAFGALLALTGLKMLLTEERATDPNKNLLVRLARRFVPIKAADTDHFFVREEGVLYATPLFLALLAAEATDVIFAVDSIPAIFAITQDPFIVFTSNIFAILGLRSLYFMLAGVIGKFHLLKPGLALVLLFVGLKMALVEVYKVPIGVSLGVIALLVGGSVVGSLVFPKAEPASSEPSSPAP